MLERHTFLGLPNLVVRVLLPCIEDCAWLPILLTGHVRTVSHQRPQNVRGRRDCCEVLCLFVGSIRCGCGESLVVGDIGEMRLKGGQRKMTRLYLRQSYEVASLFLSHKI